MKKLLGERVGYSRDRVGTHQPHVTENKILYNINITNKGVQNESFKQ